MGGCNSSCREAKGRAEEAQKRIRDNQRALERQAEESRKIQDQMQRTFDAMVDAKNSHIADLKRQLEELRKAKEAVDQEVVHLRNELIELGKIYSENMLEAQRLFAETMKQKDEQTQELMRVTLEGFAALSRESNERTERQFNRLMDQLARQDDRIGELLERMEKRLQLLENADAGIDADGNGDDFDDDDNFEPYSGLTLYHMVNDWRKEIGSRHRNVFISTKISDFQQFIAGYRF